MKFDIRKYSKYKNVSFNHEGITVDMGFHDESEARDLACDLVDTVWLLGPDDQKECVEWIHKIFKENGVDLNNE